MSSNEIININMPKDDITIASGDVFSFPTHTHSHYEMTLYQPFKGGIVVNGEFLEIDEPTIILITPSDFHRITAAGTSKFIKLGFNESVIGSISVEFGKRPLILKGVSAHRLARDLFEEIEINSDDLDYVSTLICALLRYVTKHGEVLKKAIVGKRHELAMNVLQFLNQNFCNEISLYETANRFSVTPQYLSFAFSNEIGIGFNEYLTGIRLKKACELLRSDKSNITEICFECGYRNLSHFLRSFKEKYGVTPKKYRYNQNL